ncbi:USP6 N-terminal-like protein [Watersipora subatra]|uniref:USP6 N-terminal-like protein n=1 Tax=Watersipora subatra TaxID=2589382 RepID=UPI00355AD2CC
MGLEDDDKALIDAAKERREIVERYEKGRDPDAKIDEWEDPALEIYHTTDRYGFIRDSRLPDDHEESDKEKVSKEFERIDKWRKMIKNWDDFSKGRNPAKMEKLRARVRKGIPDRLRGEIWKRLLRIQYSIDHQKGVYEKMKKRACTTSPDIRQIDLDVNRTYRNHRMFRERFGVKQKHLFHVLAAYSMYNTEVGYCQGMSQIAALLLMYMDEEEAFWGLSELLTNKKHAMHGLFIPGFPKLMRYQNHFELVLKKHSSKIYKYMNANMIPPSLYAIKWFMQCFLDRTPFPLTLRLWDVFMLEGERILIPMAYTIFKFHGKKLLKMPMERFVRFLQHDLEQDFGFSDDTVIGSLEPNREELKRSRMDVPPPGNPEEEQPQKPFGCVTYPTEEELLARQSGQLHLNDDVINGNFGSVKLRNKKVPKHLVSNDSFRSLYDNHPHGGEPVLVLPPIDYDAATPSNDAARSLSTNSQLSAAISPTNGDQVVNVCSVSPAGGNRTSAQSITPKLVSPTRQAYVLETHISVESSSRPVSFHHSSESAVSDVVELRLDLSEDDEMEANPRTSMTHKEKQMFDEELKQTLAEHTRSSRSASRSPEIDIEDNSSHMYTRNAGFRSRNLSPPGPRSRLSSNETEIPVTHMSPEAEAARSSFGVVPPSRLPLRDVRIPVRHLSPTNQSGAVSPRFPTPLERPALIPASFPVVQPKSTPAPTTRPFPVPRSNIPVKSNSNVRHHRTPEPVTQHTVGLHMVAPPSPQQRVTKVPSPPRRQMASSKSEHFYQHAHQPSPAKRPHGFHTFGGRDKREIPKRGVASPTSPSNQTFDNSQGDTRPYVIANSSHHQTLPTTHRTFYIVSDQNKQPNSRGPARYDFNEDDSSQHPVLL